MNYKDEFLRLADDNIKKYGYQLTFVNECQNPSFTYTIGLFEKFGFELVRTGAYISKEYNENIFHRVISNLMSGLNFNSVFKSGLNNKDDLKLIEMDSSWKDLMILGAFKYYNKDDIRAFQIIPADNVLLDTPIMSTPFNREDPVWCWLVKKWAEEVPISSYVTTNLDFLKGEPIIEVMRWELDYWQMFTKYTEDVSENEMIILPIGTMIGLDKTLKPSMKLLIGNGLCRKDKDSEWNSWD